jgi:hypothetical protein
MRAPFRVRLMGTRITATDEEGAQALEAIADLASGQLHDLGALFPPAENGRQESAHEPGNTRG